MIKGKSYVDTICRLLDDKGVTYRKIEHEPTRTSEESARARNEPLEVGAKALLVKAADAFVLVVIPAHRRLDSAAVKRHLCVKQLRFATSEELWELTGLVPGSVPPFGPPILDLLVLADREVGRDWDRVAFNAGSLTTSIIMSSRDWWRIVSPADIEITQRVTDA